MIGMMQRMPRAALAALAICALGTGQAPANEYPQRPVTIIVPAGAGSGPDVITRLVAERLSRGWGHQAVVSNRPGGGGMIATQAMAGVERDGHTLFMPLSSTLTVMPELQPRLPLDFDRDLVPIGLVATQPMMIAVHSSLGISSLSELVARGKSRPADLLVGASRGTIPHMAWEMFRTRAGMDATLVPYPSVARAIQDAPGVPTLALRYSRACDDEIGAELRDSVRLQRFLFADRRRIARLIDGAHREKKVAQLMLDFVVGSCSYRDLRRRMLSRSPALLLSFMWACLTTAASPGEHGVSRT